MTPKTETLYRLGNKQLTYPECLFIMSNLEPVTVHVGEYWVRNDTANNILLDENNWRVRLEKVTHVLPKADDNDPLVKQGEKMFEHLKNTLGETSDSYEYVLLKEGDEIREGDERVPQGLGLNCFKLVTPDMVGLQVGDAIVRRRLLKSELQKKFEEQKREIDNKSKKLIEAWSENAILKSEVHNLKSNLAQTQADLEQGRQENEELKKQVPRWEKSNHSGFSVDPGLIDKVLKINIYGFSTEIPHPKESPIDPAEEAWEKSEVCNCNAYLEEFSEIIKEKWINDYRAASQKGDR